MVIRARVPGARAFFVCASLLVVAPPALPLLELVRRPQGFQALLEWERQAALLGNTLALALGAVFLAVPAGVLGAVLLVRCRVPGAGFLRALVVVGVFVPLPAGGSPIPAGGGRGDRGCCRPCGFTRRRVCPG
jgi:ABC-type Fe3+ transport system permease subunit